MTTKSLSVNYTNTQTDTPQIVFTAGDPIKIDAFTATNNSNVNASFKAYIVPMGENPENPTIPFEVVVWGENKLGIGLVNQVIPKGGSLQVESSTTGAIYFTISGREIEE